jgi:hypothetical protein
VLPDLVRAANDFAASGAWCSSVSDATPEQIDAGTSAVRAAQARDWNADPVPEKIVAQNAALRLAICRAGPAAATLRHEAIALVGKLALSPAELSGLGDDPTPAVRAWIGDPATWRELQAPAPVAFHESGFGRTKSSRALLVGEELANVGQLVAIDTSWEPHVTPIVGSLEIRRPYKAEHASICVTSLDVGWLRCGAPGGLRPFGPESAPLDANAPVVFRSDSARIPCRGCHLGTGRPRALLAPLDEAKRDGDARRAALLRDIAERVRALRQESQ